MQACEHSVHRLAFSMFVVFIDEDFKSGPILIDLFWGAGGVPCMIDWDMFRFLADPSMAEAAVGISNRPIFWGGCLGTARRAPL